MAGFLLFCSPLLAVDCTPADITLASQSEVDNFQTNHGPGCDRVTGTLKVSGADIVNLSGLAALTGVHFLNITINASLTDITGLSSINTITGNLYILSNASLPNLNGLSGVTVLSGGALQISSNPSLTDLSGLSGLTSISSSLRIRSIDALVNLDAFSNLTSVGGNLKIHSNDLLTDISGLSGLTGFSGRLDIFANPLLTSLDGLSGTTSLTGLKIAFNSALTDIDELAGLTTIGNAFNRMWIAYNTVLPNLDGLADLVSLDTDLEITNNDILDSCSALSRLLDSTDDALAGPGPGVAGIPDINGDVTLGNNQTGCNTVGEIVVIPPEPGSNYALQFDGVNDYARVVGNFDFDETFTVEAWVKPSAFGGSSLFGGLVSGRATDSASSGGGWIMYLPKGDYTQWGLSVCTPGCGAAVSPSGSLVADQWIHLAASYDGSVISIYRDGVLIDSQSHTGNVGVANYLFFGKWHGVFTGLLDEIRIWNTTRTAEEILATMFIGLQGDESGLVGYWPFNEGTGQFSTDATGLGHDARLGSTDGGDDQDPLWVLSNAPIIPPEFELVPGLAGLGTDIGIRSVSNSAMRCGWSVGETVEVWWDSPEAVLAQFTVDGNGCFEGLVNLDDSERIPGSLPGEHEVQVRGSVTDVVTLMFVQVEPQLHLSPPNGPRGLEVTVSGCNWNGATLVNITWLQDGSPLGPVEVDGSGCIIQDTVTIPNQKDGVFGLLAESNNSQDSGAAYLVRGASIFLTPNEGPADAPVPLAGCNWFPNEMVDFVFTQDNVIFDTWGTTSGGCITINGPTEPTLHIPPGATAGAKIIKATGQDSGQQVSVPFTVIERTLEFDPVNGFPGDPVAVSGCGWVGNSTVTVKWGHPDTNSDPILWLADVDAQTGCFGQAGDFMIDIPLDTITGLLEQTATGESIGETTGTFTVIHAGYIEFVTVFGFAGYTKTVKIHDVPIGETISFHWDNPFLFSFDSVGAASTDFNYVLTLPKFAHLGNHVVYARGSRGMNSQAPVIVLDNSQISVTTTGDILSGSTIFVEGQNWSAGEFISFHLVNAQGSDFIDSIQVDINSINFSESIILQSDIATGNYILRATSSRGREAETPLAIIAAPAPAFSLSATFADPPPDLDGSLANGEWDYDQKADFTNGFISARSDESRLYILLDLPGDTGNDSPGNDNFWLSFDVFRKGIIDSGLDLNFRLDGSGDMILEEYTGPNSFAPRNSVNLRSAYGAGFDCFMADGSASVMFIGPVPVQTCEPHRVWEIGIDLQTIGAAPGSIVRIGVRAQSQSPAFTEDNPVNFHSDFTELGSIALAPSRLDSNPPAGAVTGIGSNGFEIEVTQAIQDVNNSLALATGKATAVRVYPQVTDEALVRVFLYGRKNGQDLPGSPLVTLATVPVAIDRENLADTANFLLPRTWTPAGVTVLTAVVENLDGSNTTALQQLAFFSEQRTPEIWVFPFNVSDSVAPVIPLDAYMVDQEQVLERMLPTPAVTFVRRPWDEINYDPGAATCPDVNTVGNNDGNLDPAEVLTCVSSHTITAKDIKRERNSRGAIAAGDGGAILSNKDNLTVWGSPQAVAAIDTQRGQASVSRNVLSAHGGELTLVLTSDVSTYDTVGDVINYSYMVTSSGTAPVAGPIAVGDSEIAVNFTTMKKKMNEFWDTTLKARAMSTAPAPMPDQFYGFKVFGDPSAVGTSDPTFTGGRGHVVVGRAYGSNRDSMVMLHELNHNLDRSSNGTWGRHVTDPMDTRNLDWGCTAKGPDLAWPYTGNDSIQEVGFDPTRPWDDGSVDHLTVVPANRNDFMSYCLDKERPTNWISPYRWQRMFTRFSPPSPSLLATAGAIGNVFYISGQVNDDGTGSLESTQLLPGVVETAVAPGEYSIEFEDSGNTVLYSMPFMASFTDVEGASQEAVFFSYLLPFHENVAEVLLKHNGLVLDSIEASLNPPTLEVTAPGDMDSWSGEELIQWTSNDLDGDPLQFTILYSPDAGVTWYPIASKLTGNEFTVNATNLPGGAGGIIMVIATDGFHTVTAESAGAFSVPNPTPIVVIDSPADGLVITPGDWVNLSGSASLPSGPADDLIFIWSVDGEIVDVGAIADILLEEGTYTITLRVYNDEGNFGEASVTVTVFMNDPPNKPINPFPGDGVSGVFVSSVPSWISGDLDGDPVTYDVYLEAGNAAPAVLVCDDTIFTNCIPPAVLMPSTQYYWQVVARDSHGETTAGDIWTFSTGDHDPEQVIYVDSFE